MSLQPAHTDTARPMSRARPTAAELRKALDEALLRVEHDGDDVEAWREIGRFRTLLREYHDAVTAFKEALERDPHMASTDPRRRRGYWLAMGFAATRSGRYDAAVEAFDELTRLHGDQPVWWIFKATALQNLGQTDSAEAALRAAAACDASQPQNRVEIAFAQGLLGRNKEALELDDAAIRDNERNLYAWANKGMHLARLARSADAEVAFARALELAPDDAVKAMILRNFGTVLAQLGQHEEARKRLEEAVKKRPDDATARRSLGFVLTALGNDTLALKHDAEAVKLAPYHAVAWRSMGVDLFHLGRYDEALHAFRQATELFPDRAETWVAQGSALWKLGEFAAAAADFEKALSYNAHCADAHLGHGASLLELGRDAEALEALRSAMGRAADRPDLWAMLGRSYRRLGNAQGAELAFRRGFALERSIAMASGVADALAAQGREDEALSFLGAELPAAQDEPLVAYLRGILASRLGRESEAIAELTSALEGWRRKDERNARVTAVARALEEYRGARGGPATTWSEHWFGGSTQATTRALGAVLLVALLAALAVPMAVPGALAGLEYGVGWAAVTLPVTVLVVLLVLPAVASVKAGGGSFEITTLVLPERDDLTLKLPSKVRIEKLPDVPTPVSDQVATFELLPALLETAAPDVEAARARRRAAPR